MVSVQLYYITNREEIFSFSNKKMPYLCGFWRFANAYCYYNGKGVEQDASKALEWYKKAAEQGNEDAKTKIKSYYKDKKASSKRYKKAAISLLAVGALIKFISDIKE